MSDPALQHIAPGYLARAEKAEADVLRLTSLLEHIAAAPPDIPALVLRGIAREHAKWTADDCEDE